MSFDPTEEQRAIIEADLVPLAVVACPGSGKTATAVRRLAELRRRLSDTRGRIALLSFSNVAVETFRDEYQRLQGISGSDGKVAIQTMDSFVTSYILRPHCARVMNARRVPFLCQGDEPFLKAFAFGRAEARIGVQDILLDRVNGATVFYQRFGKGNPVKMGEELRRQALAKLKELAAAGGYTHTHGRAWARLLLQREPGIARALARRFPQILVDEAQDIGSFEGEILDLLGQAGSTISLVGDFHQSIYGFNFASGAYLKSFAGREDVLSLPLTQNRRSLPVIVSVSNALAQTSSRPHRDSSDKASGAFYWRYEEGKLHELMSAWVSAVQAARFGVSEAAVLCRGGALLEQLTTGTTALGQSAVKHLAAAAIERDKNGDIARSFDQCLRAVAHLLNVPQTFAHDVKAANRGDAGGSMRRLVWELIRVQETGIPAAALAARGAWLTTLKKNLGMWLTRVESTTRYRRIETWNARVTSKGLPDSGPLLSGDLGQNDWSGLRIGTVHSAKGEGIPAVMYLTSKSHLDAMVAGPAAEEGRIGFVAVTRARDLLVVAIPKNTKPSVISVLQTVGLTDWMDRPLSTTVSAGQTASAA